MLGADEIGKIRRAHYRDGRSIKVHSASVKSLFQTEPEGVYIASCWPRSKACPISSSG